VSLGYDFRLERTDGSPADPSTTGPGRSGHVPNDQHGRLVGVVIAVTSDVSRPGGRLGSQAAHKPHKSFTRFYVNLPLLDLF
jgi:hypothetical protein